MNTKRTEHRVHCYQRPLQGGYVPEAGTTPEHLRAVFEEERQSLDDAARPRRRRRQPAAPITNPAQAQLQLVA